MDDSCPPLEYFARCSQSALESIELERLSHWSNLRKELRQVLEKWVECEVEARLARYLREWRQEEPLRVPSSAPQNLEAPPTAQLELPLLLPPSLPPAAAERTDSDLSARPGLLWPVLETRSPTAQRHVTVRLHFEPGNAYKDPVRCIAADSSRMRETGIATDPGCQPADVHRAVGPQLSARRGYSSKSQHQPIVLSRFVTSCAKERRVARGFPAVSSTRTLTRGSRAGFSRIPESVLPSTSPATQRSCAVLRLASENWPCAASA